MLIYLLPFLYNEENFKKLMLMNILLVWEYNTGI